MNGTLPAVSWLIPEQALSEHPPWMPVNGGWLQKQVVEAVINGKSWNDTVLLISYDEEGGWADHVTPFHSPEGTAGEWMQDPYGDFGQVFTGPGMPKPALQTKMHKLTTRPRLTLAIYYYFAMDSWRECLY